MIQKIGFLIGFLVLPLLGAHAAEKLSDRALLKYASQPYSKAEMMNKQVVLGTLKGLPVLAEFPCGDICPDYTVRAIHFVLKPNQKCEAHGGVEKKLHVQRGRGSNDETFCFPKVLTDNWESYIK